MDKKNDSDFSFVLAAVITHLIFMGIIAAVYCIVKAAGL